MISVNGHPYQIWVSCPAGPAPESGWPLTWVLEQAMFHALTTVVQNQPAGRARGLVVGVGYSGPDRRVYDYTPSVASVLPSADTAQPADTGGADDFLDFLLHEVKPWLIRSFPIDVHRQTLAGHSLGGLFALYALFQQPAVFQTYLVSSPSVWWADHFLPQAAQRFVAGYKGKRLAPPVRVGMTVGEYEQSLSPAERQRDPGWQQQQLSRRRSRRMVDEGRELAQTLRQVEGLEISFQVLDGQTHAMAGQQSLVQQSDLMFR